MMSMWCQSGFATTVGPYLGLQLGWGRLNQGEYIAWHLNKVVNKYLPDTSLNNIFFNDTGRGGRIFLGYQFNNYFAIEVGYYRFSTLEFNADLNTNIVVDQNIVDDVDINIPLSVSTQVRVQTDAFDLVAKGMYPFTDKFSVYAKLGLVALNSSGTGSITLQTPYVDVSLYTAPNVNIIYPIYGIGMNYDATQHITIDLSLMRIQQINPNLYPTIDFAAVGAIYRFN